MVCVVCNESGHHFKNCPRSYSNKIKLQTKWTGVKDNNTETKVTVKEQKPKQSQTTSSTSITNTDTIFDEIDQDLLKTTTKSANKKTVRRLSLSIEELSDFENDSKPETKTKRNIEAMDEEIDIEPPKRGKPQDNQN